MGNQQVDVRRNADASRFEAWLGGQRAGTASYRQDDGTIVFTSTEVDERFEGQGVGSALAAGALDAARAAGLKVQVLCPFIASYIRKHPEAGDLVDPDGPPLP